MNNFILAIALSLAWLFALPTGAQYQGGIEQNVQLPAPPNTFLDSDGYVHHDQVTPPYNLTVDTNAFNTPPRQSYSLQAMQQVRQPKQLYPGYASSQQVPLQGQNNGGEEERWIDWNAWNQRRSKACALFFEQAIANRGSPQGSAIIRLTFTPDRRVSGEYVSGNSEVADAAIEANQRLNGSEILQYPAGSKRGMFSQLRPCANRGQNGPMNGSMFPNDQEHQIKRW